MLSSLTNCLVNFACLLLTTWIPASQGGTFTKSSDYVEQRDLYSVQWNLGLFCRGSKKVPYASTFPSLKVWKAENKVWNNIYISRLLPFISLNLVSENALSSSSLAIYSWHKSHNQWELALSMLSRYMCRNPVYLYWVYFGCICFICQKSVLRTLSLSNASIPFSLEKRSQVSCNISVLLQLTQPKHIVLWLFSCTQIDRVAPQHGGSSETVRGSNVHDLAGP